MIKVILIDDEKHCRDLIKFYLKSFADEIHVIGEASSVREGLELLNVSNFDILFLDIDLKDGTGFDLLEQTNNKNFNLIFTTAFNDYALKAFRYSAIDYLLKPIEEYLFVESLNKVKDRLKLNKIETKLELLFENYNQKKFERISLPTSDGYQVIELEQIIRCSAEANYTHFFLKSGKKITITRTLKEYEELLPDSKFLRVHQSHIVNLSCILTYTKGEGGFLTLNDNSVVEVSRRRKEVLIRHLKNL